ncbi:protein transport protein bos1 [Lambiella insularis]|nr:protein transport protein bos1 [Lambiella insularis]
MNSLFNSALKQQTQLRNDLDTFATSPGTASSALQGQISATLTSFSRTIDDYSETAKKELNSVKQEKAWERIKNFRAEMLEYRQRFETLKGQREETQTHVNRNELLGRRPHHASTPENPYAITNQTNSPFAPAPGAGTSMSFGAAPSQQNVSRESHALREQSFFSQSNTQLDEYLERGRAVLGDLGQQREMLKGTQKRLYSVANTLGLLGYNHVAANKQVDAVAGKVGHWASGVKNKVAGAVHHKRSPYEDAYLQERDAEPDFDEYELYAREAEPEFEEYELYARDAEPEFDEYELYARDAEPEYEDFEIYAREAESEFEEYELYARDAEPEFDEYELYARDAEPEYFEERDVDMAYLY